MNESYIRRVLNYAERKSCKTNRQFAFYPFYPFPLQSIPVIASSACCSVVRLLLPITDYSKSEQDTAKCTSNYFIIAVYMRF